MRAGDTLAWPVADPHGSLAATLAADGPAAFASDASGNLTLDPPGSQGPR